MSNLNSSRLYFSSLLLEDHLVALLSGPKSIRELVEIFHPLNIIYENLTLCLLEKSYSTYPDFKGYEQEQNELLVFNPSSVESLNYETASILCDVLEAINSQGTDIEDLYMTFKTIKKIYDKTLRKIVEQIRSFTHLLPFTDNNQILLNWLEPKIAQDLIINKNFQNLLALEN